MGPQTRGWLMLALGSLGGGLARYAVAGAVYRSFGTAFPHGTMVVNLAGCLLIGALDHLAEERLSLSPSARLLLMSGFCGAFTTFSTFALETDHLLRDGQLFRAGANVGLSVVLGLVLFRAGWHLARLL